MFKILIGILVTLEMCSAGPGDPPELTEETFYEKVVDPKTLKANGKWFIKFYAPWCRHCQEMAPNWKIFFNEYHDILNIAKFNCDNDGDFCKHIGVQGYPSLLLFKGKKIYKATWGQEPDHWLEFALDLYQDVAKEEKWKIPTKFNRTEVELQKEKDKQHTPQGLKSLDDLTEQEIEAMKNKPEVVQDPFKEYEEHLKREEEEKLKKEKE